MKYRVTYQRPKKKENYSHQEVTFFDIESAVFYETEMKKRGCKNFVITPV
jgi:hypothetical protein